ncbi:DNA topoisomerase 2-binding protein 1-A [Smittium mucronatum]|uniref:DNA topoisomerase 2-binding protein 1-A n=1 Tax=Smittium mucronatum TaxID=133383 RepID=A0A1R0H3V9_9FUNG|nr:DNA topoisomerase 2-binding protein 1-A [Smittium mucronatum]
MSSQLEIPVVNGPLSGKIFSSSGIPIPEKDVVFERIRSLGGKCVDFYDNSVDILLANTSFNSDKCRVATFAKNPIVTTDFIADFENTFKKLVRRTSSKRSNIFLSSDDSFFSSPNIDCKDILLESINRNKLKTFQGCEICTTGFDSEERELIKNIVETNSGLYQNYLSRESCKDFLKYSIKPDKVITSPDLSQTSDLEKKPVADSIKKRDFKQFQKEDSQDETSTNTTTIATTTISEKKFNNSEFEKSYGMKKSSTYTDTLDAKLLGSSFICLDFNSYDKNTISEWNKYISKNGGYLFDLSKTKSLPDNIKHFDPKFIYIIQTDSNYKTENDNPINNLLSFFDEKIVNITSQNWLIDTISSNKLMDAKEYRLSTRNEKNDSQMNFSDNKLKESCENIENKYQKKSNLSTTAIELDSKSTSSSLVFNPDVKVNKLIKPSFSSKSLLKPKPPEDFRNRKASITKPGDSSLDEAEKNDSNSYLSSRKSQDNLKKIDSPKSYQNSKSQYKKETQNKSIYDSVSDQSSDVAEKRGSIFRGFLFLCIGWSNSQLSIIKKLIEHQKGVLFIPSKDGSEFIKNFISIKSKSVAKTDSKSPYQPSFDKDIKNLIDSVYDTHNIYGSRSLYILSPLKSFPGFGEINNVWSTFVDSHGKIAVPNWGPIPSCFYKPQKDLNKIRTDIDTTPKNTSLPLNFPVSKNSISHTPRNANRESSQKNESLNSPQNINTADLPHLSNSLSKNEVKIDQDKGEFFGIIDPPINSNSPDSNPLTVNDKLNTLENELNIPNISKNSSSKPLDVISNPNSYNMLPQLPSFSPIYKIDDEPIQLLDFKADFDLVFRESRQTEDNKIYDIKPINPIMSVKKNLNEPYIFETPTNLFSMKDTDTNKKIQTPNIEKPSHKSKLDSRPKKKDIDIFSNKISNKSRAGFVLNKIDIDEIRDSSAISTITPEDILGIKSTLSIEKNTRDYQPGDKNDSSSISDKSITESKHSNTDSIVNSDDVCSEECGNITKDYLIETVNNNAETPFKAGLNLNEDISEYSNTTFIRPSLISPLAGQQSLVGSMLFGTPGMTPVSAVLENKMNEALGNAQKGYKVFEPPVSIPSNSSKNASETTSLRDSRIDRDNFYEETPTKPNKNASISQDLLDYDHELMLKNGQDLKSKILKGVSLCISTRLSSIKDELTELSKKLGAEVVNTSLAISTSGISAGVPPLVTHLIHSSNKERDHLRDARWAKTNNVCIVSHHWLYSCDQSNCRLNEALFGPTYNPEKLLLIPSSSFSNNPDSEPRTNVREDLKSDSIGKSVSTRTIPAEKVIVYTPLNSESQSNTEIIKDKNILANTLPKYFKSSLMDQNSSDGTNDIQNHDGFNSHNGNKRPQAGDEISHFTKPSKKTKYDMAAFDAEFEDSRNATEPGTSTNRRFTSSINGSKILTFGEEEKDPSHEPLLSTQPPSQVTPIKDNFITDFKEKNDNEKTDELDGADGINFPQTEISDYDETKKKRANEFNLEEKVSIDIWDKNFQSSEENKKTLENLGNFFKDFKLKNVERSESRNNNTQNHNLSSGYTTPLNGDLDKVLGDLNSSRNSSIHNTKRQRVRNVLGPSQVGFVGYEDPESVLEQEKLLRNLM